MDLTLDENDISNKKYDHFAFYNITKKNLIYLFDTFIF